MAISFKKYVDIVSAVGGAAVVQARELIGRIFVDNVLIPTGTLVTFTTLSEVGLFFGMDSEEYKRARFYFSFVSKQVTSPKKIGFARWNRNDTAPMIIGGSGINTTPASWAGKNPLNAFDLTIGNDTVTITGLDFSAVVTMADVANVIQTGIRTLGGALGTMWTACTVTYNATRQSFDFVGGDVQTGLGPINIEATRNVITPNWLDDFRWDASGPFLAATARNSAGRVHTFPNVAFVESADTDNNFGSFLFMDAITDEEIQQVAQDNDARNVEFVYTIPALLADYEFICEMLEGTGGVCVTILDGYDEQLNAIGPIPDEYPEMMPMVILAATDYNRPDAAQNYMFQRADLTPVVFSTMLSNGLDACRVNYYGATQQAGRIIAFYQRGYMKGADNDPLDMNTYANEIWLKDQIGVELMGLLLALGKISANAQGRATVLSGVQVAVNRALSNGVISIGKDLTNTQRAYISSVTGNPDAWRQVQNTGYWLDCFIEQYPTEAGTEYKARYVLVYSKDDVIRKIEGSDILI